MITSQVVSFDRILARACARRGNELSRIVTLDNAEERASQSIFAPERFTTSAHLAESRRMVSANSSGVPPAGSSPISPNLALNRGEAIDLLIAPLSLSTTGLGRPAGPITPLQVLASYPGIPASAIVGRSGNPGERLGPLTASAFTFPERANGDMELRLSNITCTWPAIRSLIAIAPPL